MPTLGIDRALAAVRWRWRSSLYLRVVTTTLSLSLIVVLVLGQILVSRITSGLVDAKQRSSLVEARAGLNQAEALIAASDQTDSAGAPQLVEQIANQLANRGAGTPRLYDVLLLSTSADLPQRGSNQVTEESIPDEPSFCRSVRWDPGIHLHRDHLQRRSAIGTGVHRWRSA